MLVYHLFQVAIVVRGLLWRGQNVMCDRYVFDTMVDLQQELGYSAAKAQAILGARWIPQADSKFLLDLPAQPAFKRKPDSYSVEFLEERRVMYLHLARECELTLVDASQSVDTVLQLVTSQIIARNSWSGDIDG